jgi:hypothetical protein
MQNLRLVLFTDSGMLIAEGAPVGALPED